jgi:hypothetical protein
MVLRILSSALSRGTRSVVSLGRTVFTGPERNKLRVFTIPNILSFSRLVAAPVVGGLILNGDCTSAFYLFAAAGVTDLVHVFF